MIIVALALSLSFPLALIFCPTLHSRAPTDKHPTLTLLPIKKPFNQLLKAQFWLMRSLESNLSNARTTLTLLEPVILTEYLPTWFHMKTSALNKLNTRRGSILLKRPPALYHGLKWNSVVEEWTVGTSYSKDLQYHVVTPQRSHNAKIAKRIL